MKNPNEDKLRHMNYADLERYVDHQMAAIYVALRGVEITLEQIAGAFAEGADEDFSEIIQMIHDLCDTEREDRVTQLVFRQEDIWDEDEGNVAPALRAV